MTEDALVVMTHETAICITLDLYQGLKETIRPAPSLERGTHTAKIACLHAVQPAAVTPRGHLCMCHIAGRM